MNKITERITALRELMAREHLDAFIFPSTDPHNGEYVPEHWESRKWISGFTGSAGTAVVTMTSAALWTDSRYFIAAAEELSGTEYQLMKEKIPGTPSISQWLATELCHLDSSRGPEVGLDGMVNSATDVEALITDMRHYGITVRTNMDPLRDIWRNRPAIPLSKVEIQPLEYAGTPVKDKLIAIRRALRQQHAEGMLVTALDDIAWTLNIRAQDVHCCPVCVSYLLISSDKTILYINKEKLTAEATRHLTDAGIGIDDYDNIIRGLKAYPEYNILIDKSATCYTLYKTACNQAKIIEASSPIPTLKAIKSEAEIRGYRNAMLRDGIALTKFHRWLDEDAIREGATEMTIDKKLREFRSEQPLFRDISFDTIAGYGPHGAIVHYEASEQTDVPLQPKGFVLIDSGAHYQDGSTDITRTIALGPLTDEERLVYTLVLKGHIQLELVRFPDGASGTQIDALARKDMWQYGYNYLHGTGHGIGSYLNVHEGPHQIRMEYRPAPLHAGMTVTDEPGVYVEGKFGVRIENTLIIEDGGETAYGKFLKMDSLTLCPIDKRPIIWSMLSPEEIQWLNNYHQRVFIQLSPHVSGADLEWLRKACEAH